MPRKLTHIQICKKCLKRMYGKTENAILLGMLNYELRSKYYRNAYLANTDHLPWCQEEQCYCILEHTVLSQNKGK
jgi:hypothetical protein